jgi:hypothetical protein
MRCTAALLSRTYVFAAFDGRWPGVTFLVLALSGKLALGPIALGRPEESHSSLKAGLVTALAVRCQDGTWTSQCRQDALLWMNSGAG